jgi:hypothetical protein
MSGGIDREAELRARQDALYADEPWAKLAVQTGFRPYDTESAARCAFRFAAEREAELVEALRGLDQFFARPDECSIGKFDRLAETYRRETGEWAPGKDIPDALGDSTSPEMRRERYDAWVQSKVNTARALLAKIDGDAK